MLKRHLPSVEALTSSDDDLLKTELSLSEVREQLRVVRALVDEVEDLVPLSVTGHASGSGRAEERADRAPSSEESAAVIEELARLGCRIVELAGALSRIQERPTTQRAEGKTDPVHATMVWDNRLKFIG